MRMRTWWHHSSPIWAFFLTVAGSSACATEVNVVGLFSGKALVSIDGGRPRMLSVGEKTPDGIKLISADSDGAVLEIDGKRRTLTLGQSISASSTAPGIDPTVVLTADSQGHFLATGSINGAPTRFLVDTGASFVSMSSAEAKRLGISYLQGERAFMSTANGTVVVYRVNLNTVRLGDITLNQVEAAIHEGSNLPVTLLGMSFLKRLEIRREGTTLTLVKRY